MVRYLLTILVLITVTALTWWVNQLLEPEREKRAATPANGPDHYVENFISKTMNKDGQVTHELQAPYLVHYLTNDRAEVKQPHMTFYKEAGETWHIDADQATTFNNGAEVILVGNVVLHRPAAKREELRINTERLRVLSKEQYAETQDHIVMANPSGTVEAVGMQANFKSDQVELLSKVRGYYAPH
jgi:LPS export ABC transporter protein LptC